MMILLVVLLFIAFLALVVMVHLFMIAKGDVERLDAENLKLSDKNVDLETKLQKLERRHDKAALYFNRSTADLRNQLAARDRTIRKKDEHHKTVVKDLNRRRQTMIDAYEDVLATHTLFPNYVPSHLTAA